MLEIVVTSSLKKPEGKRTLGRRGRKRKDNIKMNIKEIACKGVDWIHLT
jgi:hypothetical protein